MIVCLIYQVISRKISLACIVFTFLCWQLHQKVNSTSKMSRSTVKLRWTKFKNIYMLNGVASRSMNMMGCAFSMSKVYSHRWKFYSVARKWCFCREKLEKKNIDVRPRAGAVSLNKLIEFPYGALFSRDPLSLVLYFDVLKCRAVYLVQLHFWGCRWHASVPTIPEKRSESKTELNRRVAASRVTDHCWKTKKHEAMLGSRAWDIGAEKIG